MNKNCNKKGCTKIYDCNCDCDCYQPHPPNCELVLESFHKSIFEAFEIFAQSEKFEAKALREAIESIEALKESMRLDDKGEKIFRDAEHALDHSGCKLDCNKNSCKCKALDEKVRYYFDVSDELKYESLCLLEDVVKKLQASIKAQEKAVQLAEDYSKCVHQKNPCKH